MTRARDNADFTGVTDGSSASAGEIGELLTATTGGAVTFSTTAANMLSLSVTAGDWDISSNFVYSGPDDCDLGRCSITETSATMGTFGVDTVLWAIYNGGGAGGGSVSPVRFSFTATTTVYLVAKKNSGDSGDNFYGTLYARRMR